MQCNVGKTDKIIRSILGIVFLILSFTYSIWFLVLFLIMVFTAGVSFCPLYKVLGINTCRENTENK